MHHRQNVRTNSFPQKPTQMWLFENGQKRKRKTSIFRPNAHVFATEPNEMNLNKATQRTEIATARVGENE